MQYEIVFKGDRWCSCYTCLPQSSPAAQTAQKMAPGTPPMAQRLLTIATPKQKSNTYTYMQTKVKDQKIVHHYIKIAHKAGIKLIYALQ